MEYLNSGAEIFIIIVVVLIAFITATSLIDARKENE